MMKISHFFFGYKDIIVNENDSAKAVSALMNSSLPYDTLSLGEEGLRIRALPWIAGRIVKLLGKEGIDYQITSVGGLPGTAIRYRKRYGALAGLLLYAAIVFFSGRVIWSVEIEGNRVLEDGEIRDVLREHGVSVGARVRGIDVHSVENRIMISSDEIAWMSVNISGNTCRVEIRERQAPPEEERYAAANIVAERDGTILLFEDVRGNILLKIGDYVREGELIVSGLYDSRFGGVRYTAAKGRVLAETERELVCDIPLKYEKKVYTGEEFTEKYIIFFEKEIKFFGKCGNLYGSCDKIEMVEYFDPLGFGKLPFGIRTVTYRKYSTVTDERSEDEAKRLAYDGLMEQIAKLGTEAELLGKEIFTETGDGFLRGVARLRVVENIAKIKEIEISALP